MGRVSGPFGVKGWIKLQPFTAEPKNLLGYRMWWLESESGWVDRTIEQAQVQGDAIAAKLEGCDDRDAAALLRGRHVAIPRDAFPEAGENEFYWADLVGLKVVNIEGDDLGRVSRVVETGANDVLVVEGDRERLIPFIEQVVQQVDLPGGVIRVDWEPDF